MSSGAWIVLGAAVGALASLVGGYVERTARARGELMAAAAAWLAATHSFAQIAQTDSTYSTPASNKVGEWLESLADVVEQTIGPGRVEILRALVQRPLIKRIEVVNDRVWETTMLLVLRSPGRLLRQLEPHLEVLAEWLRSPDDAMLRKQWETEAYPAIIRTLRRTARPSWRRLLRLS